MSRSLTTTFAAEKNKTFARPFPSAVFHFGGAVGDIYISNHDLLINGNQHKGCVANWGEYQAMAHVRDGMFSTGSMRLTIVNRPIFGSPLKRFSDLFAGIGVEGIEVEVNQNFMKSDSPGTIYQAKLLDGVIRPGRYWPDLCEIEIAPISEKYLNAEISFPIDQTDFPQADTDDIGKRANVVYGTVKKAVSHAVVAGPSSVLRATMGTSDTTVPIHDDFHDILPGSGTVQIGNEKIAYTGKGGSAGARTLTGLTRGSGSTPVESHLQDDTILQVLSSYVYMAAGHTMKAIDRVYIKRGDKIIPLAASQYTVSLANTTLVSGKTLTTITFTAPPLVAEKDFVSLTDAIGVADTIGVAQTNTESVWEETFSDSSDSLPSDANFLDNESQSVGGSTMTPAKTKSSGNYVSSFSYRIASGSVGPAGVKLIVAGVTVMDGSTVLISSPVQVVVASPPVIGGIGRTNLSGSTQSISAITVEIKAQRVSYPISVGVTKTGTVAKTGTASLGTTSTAEKVIGDAVLFDGGGYADDGSGTYTGTASALVEKCADVLHHLARVPGAIPAGRVDAASFATARTDAPASYKFSGVVSDRATNLKELLLALGMQSRIRVDWPADVLSARFLKSTYGAVSKTITQNQIRAESANGIKTTLRVSRSPFEEIINKIDLRYGRDWSMARGEDAFQKISKASDATSITRYGVREDKNRFRYDFIAADNSTMADDVRAFWLARLKDPARLAELEAFLDQFELLPGDLVALKAQMPDGSYFDSLDGNNKFLAEDVRVSPNAPARGQSPIMRLQFREVT